MLVLKIYSVLPILSQSKQVVNVLSSVLALDKHPRKPVPVELKSFNVSLGHLNGWLLQGDLILSVRDSDLVIPEHTNHGVFKGVADEVVLAMLLTGLLALASHYQLLVVGLSLVQEEVVEVRLLHSYPVVVFLNEKQQILRLVGVVLLTLDVSSPLAFKQTTFGVNGIGASLLSVAVVQKDSLLVQVEVEGRLNHSLTIHHSDLVVDWLWVFKESYNLLLAVLATLDLYIVLKKR
jgi:hypothetical protein